jgi:hypothetical protein
VGRTHFKRRYFDAAHGFNFPAIAHGTRIFSEKVSKMPFLKGHDLEVQKEFQKNICRSKSLF